MRGLPREIGCHQRCVYEKSHCVVDLITGREGRVTALMPQDLHVVVSMVVIPRVHQIPFKSTNPEASPYTTLHETIDHPGNEPQRPIADLRDQVKCHRDQSCRVDQVRE